MEVMRARRALGRGKADAEIGGFEGEFARVAVGGGEVVEEAPGSVGHDGA
ncbi:hypothetical protein Acsp03_69150 [Actinomadura sp. NBRC 104412]|nr:hypothetical protein Acsp03_69150 [Actinomadura sp. NBRC 104412]